MTEFAEDFAYEADDMMDGILAESSDAMSPTLTPFVSLGSAEAPILDGPTTKHQAEARDLFQAFDDGTPSVDRMKRAGLHHDEIFEL
ncbi:MAG: hypothetical protein JHD02_06425 [Thermoleophilaceae bacterium]|nr:hypothetical protein [Thermoleophilaceae bacterium]